MMVRIDRIDEVYARADYRVNSVIRELSLDSEIYAALEEPCSQEKESNALAEQYKYIE